MNIGSTLPGIRMLREKNNLARTKQPSSTTTQAPVRTLQDLSTVVLGVTRKLFVLGVDDPNDATYYVL